MHKGLRKIVCEGVHCAKKERGGDEGVWEERGGGKGGS
jgi:hypothetical protein